MNILDRIDFILETFKEMGKLSPDELRKGQKLVSDGDNFKEVSGRIFYQSINKIRSNDIEKLNKGLPSKGLKTLSVYDVKEYKKMKCFLGKNNSSGYCIAHGDELVSVFSSQGSSGNELVKNAVKNGTKRLDCFALQKDGKIEGPLFKLYSKYGFKVDKSMNSGKKGEPYSIQNGVSYFVNVKEEVDPDNPQVVVFMKR